MIRSAVFSLLLLCSFLTGISQNIDSLKYKLKVEKDPIVRGDLYADLGLKHLRIDVTKAKRYIDSAEAIQAYVADLNGRNYLRFIQSSYAFRIQKFDSSYSFLELIIEEHERTPIDSMTLGKAYYKIGDIARIKREYDKAIEPIQRSKDIFAAIGEESTSANGDVLLGLIYKNTGQLDKAVEYYDAALKVYESLNNYDAMATCILNIASVRTNQDRIEEALEMFDQAEELAGKMANNNDNLLAYIFGNRSSLFKRINQPQKAYDEMLKAFELRKNNAQPRELANSFIGLGASALGLKKYSLSEDYFLQAKEIIEKNNGMIEMEALVNNSLFQLYKSRGKDKLAIEHVEKYLKLNDSIRNVALDKKVIELNEQLETERKEKEIIALNSEQEMTQSELRSSKLKLWGALLGLLGVSGFSFGMYRLFRKTKEQKKIIETSLHEKEVLLKEIHHRVKNNLQFISSLLGLQTEYISDQLALDALQEGQDRVQSMALIHQNLYQEDDLTGVDMQDYFEKLILGLFDSYNIHEDRINLQLNIQPISLDVDTVIPIGLIVNELISNSLKYAFPEDRSGMITVGLEEVQDTLKLTVSDNGIGFDDSVKNNLGDSFGYKLVDAFKQQLHATVNISGDDGTSVEFLITRYEKTSA